MRIFIKNMVSERCKVVVRDGLAELGATCVYVGLGYAEIAAPLSPARRVELNETLMKSGLELLEDKRSVLIEKIKNVVIQLVHYTDEQIKMNFSGFLSQKLGYDYTYLANIFSASQGTSIEKFKLAHRIERVKELMGYGELNMTEIARKLHFSSVAHLSNQFKKITGLTPSHFRQLKHKIRRGIENV